MPPDATCVVDSAKPRCDDARIAVAVEVWAAKPWAGSMVVRPRPRVWVMRQPPRYVPSAIARPALTITQTGGAEPGASEPDVISASVMMPMVFCASFVPCASETSDADAT